MSYYSYQYQRQCFIPGGAKIPAPAFPQPCHGRGLLPCPSCSPCAPSKAPCAPSTAPCGQGCAETRVVQGHRSSSSSSSGCLDCCPAPFPQPPVQGGGLAVLGGCPQGCQDGSCPFSYQWSNSYRYSCGH